ncbi:MAG: phenylalanine--tRNA ligase beta subunit-related protein [Rhizobiaceae bacterium]
MNQLTLRIDPKVLGKYPNLSIACLTAQIDDPSSLNNLVEDLTRQVPTIVEHLNSVEPITQLPEIAVWRDAYAGMGIKPSKFHSSIEALSRRVKKGDDILTGLSVVDLYNLTSVLHGTPMGAYDLKKLEGPELTLRLANPVTDRFEPLGGRPESYPLNEDLVVYAAGDDILCWGFNTRDAVISCVDEASRSIVFLSEATSEAAAQRPKAALNALAAQMAELGITTSDVQIVDSSNPDIGL